MIFDEATLRNLENLTLVASRVRAGAIKGERRSTRKGASVEFADYRNYTPGDDLRRLDWNVYARLNRPYLKLFEDEEDLAVHLLVDGSASMNWGVGEQNKFMYALRLAGALGLIALSGGDQLSIVLLHGPSQAKQFGPHRGRINLKSLLAYLESQQAHGQTDLDRALHGYSQLPRRAGLAIVISDLYSPTGYRHGLSALQRAGHEAILIQVHTPDEIEPPITGDLRLIDVETAQFQEVTLTRSMHRLYRERIKNWHHDIKTFCRSRRIHYLNLTTSYPWNKAVLYELRKRGIVQ